MGKTVPSALQTEIVIGFIHTLKVCREGGHRLFKGIRDKFGNNYWVADLRRPKKQDEIRINYLQNGNINKYPEKIIDYADKEIEFINDPNRLKKK